MNIKNTSTNRSDFKIDTNKQSPGGNNSIIDGRTTSGGTQTSIINRGSDETANTALDNISKKINK